MRIVFSCFGSAGDLFPLVPLARQLERQGHDPLFICPRTLGLYLRAARITAVGLGDGDEVSAVSDSALFTTERGGWLSWEHLWNRYIEHGLRTAVVAARRLLTSTDSEIVATSTFAAPVRIAALQMGIPHVALTIYPQYLRPVDEIPLNFALAYRETVRRVSGDDLYERFGEPLLAWGAEPHAIVLHDPVLLDRSEPIMDLVGFPYWDAGAGTEQHTARLLGWIDSSALPVALVTLGSFIGIRHGGVVASYVQALVRRGFRVLIVGSTPGSGDIGSTVLSTGFVPLSRLLPAADIVVHHGGIGTTFATLKAGKPAIVVPQAFDQPFTAGLLESAGLAVDASNLDPGAAIDRLLAMDAVRRRAAMVASRLIDTDVAAAAAVSLMKARAAGA